MCMLLGLQDKDLADWMRHNIVFNLHLRARVRQHCISGSPGLLVGGVVSFLLLLLLFLMKSSQH